jgi:hypothetical protein
MFRHQHLGHHVAASLEITVHWTFADFEERSNVLLVIADANARHNFSPARMRTVVPLRLRGWI